MTSPDRNREYSDIAAMVTTIMHYFVDTAAMQTDMKSLSLVLDGGSIPDYAVEVLRPIVWKLLTADRDSLVLLSEADLSQLEGLHEEIALSIEQRQAAQRQLQNTITAKTWCDAENALASGFGLQVLPANDRSLDTLFRQIEQSDFTLDEIVKALDCESILLTEFCIRWYADSARHDYGEEWDPVEGNQQDDSPPRKKLGMGMAQGFMVGNAILYLYAARKSDLLLKFLQRRRIPHAGKVAKDVMRIYRKTTGMRP